MSSWKPAGEHIQVKQYTDYDTYVDEQQSKLDGRPGWCKKQSDAKHKHMLDWLPTLKILSRGMTVLCLGARLGGEVAAFIELECFAVGIDLNPGAENPYVLHGDFHKLLYGDRTIDLIFCNCIDHVQDMEAFLSEICRALKHGGTLLIQAKYGTHEGGGSDPWDCLEWDTTDNLNAHIQANGFKLECCGWQKAFRGMPHWFLYTKR